MNLTLKVIVIFLSYFLIDSLTVKIFNDNENKISYLEIISRNKTLFQRLMIGYKFNYTCFTRKDTRTRNPIQIELWKSNVSFNDRSDRINVSANLIVSPDLTGVYEALRDGRYSGFLELTRSNQVNRQRHVGDSLILNCPNGLKRERRVKRWPQILSWSKTTTKSPSNVLPTPSSVEPSTAKSLVTTSKLETSTDDSEWDSFTFPPVPEWMRSGSDFFNSGSKSTESSHSVDPIDYKPSESSHSVDPIDYKPSESSHSVDPIDYKPSESSHSVDPIDYKPSESSHSVDPMDYKPSESSHSVDPMDYKPSESSHSVDPIDYKPSESSHSVDPIDYKPSESSHSVDPIDYKPSESSHSVDPIDYKPSESSHSVDPMDYKPSESSHLVDPIDYKPTESSHLVDPMDYKLSESSDFVDLMDYKPTDSTTTTTKVTTVTSKTTTRPLNVSRTSVKSGFNGKVVPGKVDENEPEIEPDNSNRNRNDLSTLPLCPLERVKNRSCVCMTIGNAECSKYNALCVGNVSHHSGYLCRCPNGFTFLPSCYYETNEKLAFRCDCPRGKIHDLNGICIDNVCKIGGRKVCAEREAKCRIDHQEPRRYDCLCRKGTFMGPNEKCISVDLVNLNLHEEYQTVRQGQTVLIRCRDEGRLRLPTRWTRSGNLKLSAFASQLKDRLVIRYTQPSDSGVYVCYVGTNNAKLVPKKIARVKITPYSCGLNFECDTTKQCVDNRRVCDGRMDCADNMDEMRCLRKENEHYGVRIMVYHVPRFVVEGSNTRLFCRDEGPSRLPVEWYRDDNLPLPRQSMVRDGTLFLRRVQLSDSGYYTCKAVGILRHESCCKEYVYLNIKTCEELDCNGL